MPVLLFLHIPKTGGSTLKSCINQSLRDPHAVAQSAGEADATGPLARFYRHGIFYYPTGFYADPAPLDSTAYGEQLGARNLRAVIGHFSYGIHRHIPKRCRYLTFLRDPVERVLSLYFHQKANRILREGVTISQFVTDMTAADWNVELTSWYPQSPGFSEDEIRNASRLIGRNDQARRIAGCYANQRVSDTKMLAQAKANLETRFAFVGTSEKFDESLLLMARSLGWNSLPNYFPRLVNRVKASAAPEAEELELIKSSNALDIELYEFARSRLEVALENQGDDFRASLEAYRNSNAMFQKAHAGEVDQWSLQ